MSRIRDMIGLDGKDLMIHIGATVLLVVIGHELNVDDGTIPRLIGAASAILLGLRIFVARRARPETPSTGGQVELEELDDRLYELEQERARLLELEERVDFAERLLVSKQEAPPRVEKPK